MLINGEVKENKQESLVTSYCERLMFINLKGISKLFNSEFGYAF